MTQCSLKAFTVRSNFFLVVWHLRNDYKQQKLKHIVRPWLCGLFKLFIPSSTTHHFLHGHIVGKTLGDDISVGQQHVADGLEGETRVTSFYTEIMMFII